MSKKWKSDHVVIEGDGDPCPRCGLPTEIREHAAITDKHLAQPFHYTRWFHCTRPECATKGIRPDRYRVFRDEQTRARWEAPTEPRGDIALDVLDELRSDAPPF
jgi:hypothetical protein